MACKHTNIDCGCKDSFLTTPAPCPTPDDCPEAQPCSEVFDAQCIVYTGDDVICDDGTVVETNTTVSDAIQDIVDYFCTQVTALNQQITALQSQVDECCGGGQTPLLVEIVKQGDFNKFSANVAGGTPVSYTWSFSSIHNNVDVAPDNSMYTLQAVVPPNSSQTWYTDNVNITNVFDACSSTNVGRIGLLQVTVVDSLGRVAKDYKLITTIVCA